MNNFDETVTKFIDNVEYVDDVQRCLIMNRKDKWLQL